MDASTGSSVGTAGAASSAPTPPLVLSIDDDRRSAVLATKLRAMVGARWGLPAEAVVDTSVIGATLADREGGRTWVLTDDDPERRLGMALALAVRGGTAGQAAHLHVIVDDAAPGGVLARRAALVESPTDVWVARGPELTPAEPAPPASDPPPPPVAELYRPVLAEAGLEPVVEGGELIGEVLGLEVARVVVDDSGEAHLEAGVGRFDREAGAMMFAHLGETDAVARAAEVVRRHRKAGAARHPLNQLVPDRWLRSLLAARPDLVGAAELRPVGSALPRRNLRESGVATLVGRDADGGEMVVVCSTGVHLDLVPSAADDRLTHAPNARLVLAVPEGDALGITTELAGLLRGRVDVVTVPRDWREISAGVG